MGPPGFTPFPDAVEAPVAAQAPECGSRVVDLRMPSVDASDRASMDAYITAQKATLTDVAESAANALAQAGVNLRSPLPDDHIQSLLTKHSLTWANIYWEATNGAHGAITNGVGPQSLKELEIVLRQEGEIGETDYVVGSRYFTTYKAPAKSLLPLQLEESVLLVDIGRFAELEAAVAEAGASCVRFALPDPIAFDFVEQQGQP